MIIKVCGLREKENHRKLSDLSIDMIGINFYNLSSRYIGQNYLEVREQQKRVGVFVQASLETIAKSKREHHLDYAQLHGDEDADLCRKVQQIIPIIKVFRIDKDLDIKLLEKYSFADYFLFDTKTLKFGGSGNKFKWSVLNKYNLKVPFFLSGGIGPDDADKVKKIRNKQLIGVDINSKFESSPAVKDYSLVRDFIENIKN